MGLVGSGVALKRMSLVDLREMEKPKGDVLWRVNVRSEFGCVKVVVGGLRWCCGGCDGGGGGGGRGRML